MTDDVLVVHGGTPLHGRIRVRGAKNLVSKAMVATLLGDGPSRLFDVPRIRDVEVVRGLLELHGVKVTDGDEDGELVFDPTNVESASTDEINVHAGSRSSSAGRCCTGWGMPSSPTWAAATSAPGRSTSTCRRCVSSARRWRRPPRACT